MDPRHDLAKSIERLKAAVDALNEVVADKLAGTAREGLSSGRPRHVDGSFEVDPSAALERRGHRQVGEVGSGTDVIDTLVGQDSGTNGEDVVDVAVAPMLGQDGEIADDGVVVVVTGSHEAD
jgi:hypothetical protein